MCIIFASVSISSAWSADEKKPKKSYSTVLVRKTEKMHPKIIRISPEKQTIPSMTAALLDTKELVVPTKTEALPPTPWQAIATEKQSITVVVINPTMPEATPPPTNPYLQKSSYRDDPSQFLPTPGANPLESLKSVALLILPNGIGQVHPPLYVRYIKQPESQYTANQKPILLFELNCPTKALFGFDTPIIALLQIVINQIIDTANATNISGRVAESLQLTGVTASWIRLIQDFFIIISILKKCPKRTFLNPSKEYISISL